MERPAQLAKDAHSGRSRSFGGCATCRIRHMKCDEALPTCLMCENAGVVCGGYEKSIFFDFEGPSHTAALRFRRPLLSEAERERMSAFLTASIPPKLALWHLAQIDDICEDTPPSKDVQISRGPFGAFKLAVPPPVSPQDPSNDWLGRAPSLPPIAGEPCLSQDNLDNLEFLQGIEFSPFESAMTPRTQHLFDSISQNTDMHTSSSPSMDLWNGTGGFGRVHELYHDVDVAMPAFPRSDTTNHDSQSFTTAHVLTSGPANFPMQGHDMYMSPIMESPVPHDAIHLVKHYSTTILRLLTPFRHTKTPWHVLFIPHVKNCLAALTLGEDMDHASLCAFYGTLAISAFSLEGISQSLVWHEKGKRYKRQAHGHAMNMLQTAYDVPKTAKYKSILIALLTMVQVSLAARDQEQIECYLLEAERFIRVKGLNRRKSRKVRLLHHCYVFERMFHESMCVDGMASNRRHLVRKAIEASGAGAYSRDSLSFRLSEWGNLEEEMQRIKGKEEGENDLHLQFPGAWSATLYPEIFAIPERYILLLSLTIRLGEEKDHTKNSNATEVLGLRQFLDRAKAIERCINQLRITQQPIDNLNSLQSQPPGQIFDNLLDAMQHALAIYFYRRIYDLDPSVLQAKVNGVRDCLCRFEAASPDMIYGSARLIWPAFVAACEAEDPDTRASFVDWFQNSTQRSGLRYFADARETVEKVWEQKRSTDRTNITWLELMKNSFNLVQ